MVVGPTGGGKTVILETLSRSQTKMEYPTTLFIINSKAQPTHELYGLMGNFLNKILKIIVMYSQFEPICFMNSLKKIYIRVITRNACWICAKLSKSPSTRSF